MTVSRWIILRMRCVSIKSCRENQNRHFMFINFFPKVVPLWYNVEKCGGAREAASGNMAASFIQISNATLAQAHASARARAPTHLHTHTHTHTNTHALRRTHTQRNMQDLLLFHGSGFVNLPKCYVIRALPVCLSCFVQLSADVFQ